MRLPGDLDAPCQWRSTGFWGHSLTVSGGCTPQMSVRFGLAPLPVYSHRKSLHTCFVHRRIGFDSRRRGNSLGCDGSTNVDSCNLYMGNLHTSMTSSHVRGILREWTWMSKKTRRHT